jgi:hypothetical protein
MMLNNLEQKNTVYVAFEEGGIFYECVGLLVDENELTITVGYNFYLGDAIDSSVIARSSIVKMEDISLLTPTR